jgi:hypothetical protein
MRTVFRVGTFILACFAGGTATAQITGCSPFYNLPNNPTLVGDFGYFCSTTQTYTTEIKARTQGGLVYDQTFNAPFSDTSVQAAVAAAEALLISAGALSVSGPTLTSNQTTTLPDVTTVFGPTTLSYGNIGTCQGVTPYPDGLGGTFYKPFGCTQPGVCQGEPVFARAGGNGFLYFTYYLPAQCPSTGGDPIFASAGNTLFAINVDTQLTQVYEVDGFTTRLIMIKPSAPAPAPINPRSPGETPVAVLSSPAFDATTQVDRTSLTFGRTGNEKSLLRCDPGGLDVNGDGLLDLVCHFSNPLEAFKSADTKAYLRGSTILGLGFLGWEAIRTVP